MMVDEALAAALQGPRDDSALAYQDLVQTLITEAEVDAVQERAWQRQRRSDQRVQELEAREAGKAGWKEGVSAEVGEDGKTSQTAQGVENTSQVLPLGDDVPSPRVDSSSLLASPEQTGKEIRALEAELARSMQRERDSVRLLQEYGQRPGSSSRLEQNHSPRGHTTETGESNWNTESESDSQESMERGLNGVGKPNAWDNSTPSERRFKHLSAGESDGWSSEAGGNRPAGRAGNQNPHGKVDGNEAVSDKRTAPFETGKPGTSEASKPQFPESASPRTPRGWKEIALVKAEQLEEAKLLLVAVMDGERAALETVARLELELQESKEAQEAVQKEAAEAASNAKAVIDALSEKLDRKMREQDGMDGGKADGEDQRSADGQDNGRPVRVQSEGNGPVLFERRRQTGLVSDSSTSEDERLAGPINGRLRDPPRQADNQSTSATDSDAERAVQMNARHLLGLSMREPAVGHSKTKPESRHSQGEVLKQNGRPVQDLDDLNAGLRGKRESTVEEVRAREAAYRDQCEELQQQVRGALDHVEQLRRQQSEREARAAAAYETRLSAYVKQMVAVKRENEELRSQEQTHREEAARFQEQLDAEHQKRREEFLSALGRVDLLSGALRDLSERLDERTSELARRRRTVFLPTDESEPGAKAGATELGRCGTEGLTGKELVASCQNVLRSFEVEADEIEEALGRAAEMRDKVTRQATEIGRLVASRDEVSNRLNHAVDQLNELEGEREKCEEALARERVLLVELDGERAERRKMEEEVGRLKGELVGLGKTKAEYETKVAALEGRLRQQESGLAHYKAEIQQELAGLSEQMHQAAAERVREDAAYQTRLEENGRAIRTRDEAIGRLEGEVRELQLELRTEREVSESVRMQLRVSEKAVEEARKNRTNFDGLEGAAGASEGVRTGVPAVGNGENASERADWCRNCAGECAECEKVQREWEKELRTENGGLWEFRKWLEEELRTRQQEVDRLTGVVCDKDTQIDGLDRELRNLVEEKKRSEQAISGHPQGLVKHLEVTEAEVKRLKVLLEQKEVRVAGLEARVREMLREKGMLELELERGATRLEAFQSQSELHLRYRQSEIDGLKRKLGEFERDGGVDSGEQKEGGWDEVQKERLIAEVQQILEQYDKGSEKDSGWPPKRRRDGERAARIELTKRLDRSEEDGLSDYQFESEGASERTGGMENKGGAGATDHPGGTLPRPVVSASLQSGRQKERESAGNFEDAWAEREGRIRTEVQAVLAEFERQEETLRRASEAEVAALKEKVRLLEQAQKGGTLGAQGSDERLKESELRDGLSKNGVVRVAGPDRGSGGQTETKTDGRSHGGNVGPADRTVAPGPVPFATKGVFREQLAEQPVRTTDGFGQSGRLANELADPSAGLAATEHSVRSTPEERQSLDSGQSGVWRDKHPTGGEGQMGDGAEKRAERLPAEATVPGVNARAQALQENASLRSNVAELRQVNQELQLRVKVLEEDRSRLLVKLATLPSLEAEGRLESQASELAALQAQLAEAAARLSEQRGRYKHLKGKYLRQLARQQAMHEYMQQGGESPANLSPRSGVAPSVGRPQTAPHDPRPTFRPLPSNPPPIFEADDRGPKHPGQRGDFETGEEHHVVAQTAQRQSGHDATEQIAKRGPSSSRGLQGAGTQFFEQGRSSPGSSGGGTAATSRQVSTTSIFDERGVADPAQYRSRPPSQRPSGTDSVIGRSRNSSRRPSDTDYASFASGVLSQRPSKTGSVASRSGGSSRRPSGNDSVPAYSEIPVGLRMLMDGRPLPGFPAKVEDLGGYFSAARAEQSGPSAVQSKFDGAWSAKCPSRRASSPHVQRQVERRSSRASSAPPTRPSYNRMVKVWV